MRKKAVSPASRRAYAKEVVDRTLCSQRQACRYLKLARSTFHYRGRPPTPAQEQLKQRLLELSAEHPRYGYRRIAALLRREGWKVGKWHTQRLRRDAGLQMTKLAGVRNEWRVACQRFDEGSLGRPDARKTFNAAATRARVLANGSSAEPASMCAEHCSEISWTLQRAI